jgi:hypothetical protein
MSATVDNKTWRAAQVFLGSAACFFTLDDDDGGFFVPSSALISTVWLGLTGEPDPTRDLSNHEETECLDAVESALVRFREVRAAPDQCAPLEDLFQVFI